MVIIIETGIYIRVSTEEQAQNGYSIRAQMEKLSVYSKIKDWNVIDFYIDEGLSGKNISERKELIRLIEDIKAKKVNNVLVYKIDRLTRSTKDLIELVELFNKYNCSFNSLNESIDTKSSTGRMFIKIIGIFAEFERENIVERVKLGLERKVKEGYTIASRNLSYGYKKEKGEKIQKIDKEKSVIVKKIYEMFLNGKSYTEIAKYLNIKNIPTLHNKKWSYKTVKLILTNPNYEGKVRYGINTNRYFEVMGRHENIINKNEYEKVKKIIYAKKEKSLLNGKVKCICGSDMLEKKYVYDTIKGKKNNYIRYICKNKNCDTKSIGEKFLYKKIALLKLNVEDIKEIIVEKKEVKKIITY